MLMDSLGGKPPDSRAFREVLNVWIVQGERELVETGSGNSKSERLKRVGTGPCVRPVPL